MKPIGTELKSFLAGGSTSLCRIWVIRLKNGEILRFNDGSSDLFYSNKIYVSNPGIEISAIRDSSDNGFADATITTVMNEDYISEDMVRYRFLRDATFTINAVDYEHPEKGAMYLFGGVIGDYTITGMSVEFEVRGNGELLSAIVLGEYYSERCRNVFGDKRCRVNVALYEVPFEVTGIEILQPNKFYTNVTLPSTDITNEELGSIHIETDNLGSGVFKVPNTRQFTVVLRGGGAVDTYATRFGDVVTLYPGYDGETATFGKDAQGAPLLTAQGGRNNAERTGRIGTPMTPGMGMGGDTNTTGGGRDGTNPGASQGGLYDGDSRGNGGLCQKTYYVGEGKDFQVGDEIPYNLGDGNDENEQFPLIPGDIKITSRNIITTIEPGYKFGSVRWTKGPNVGYTHEIVGIDAVQFVTLQNNVNAPIEIGDEGVFATGCTNYRSNCKVYNNLPRFRAEPDTPVIQPKPNSDPSNLIPDPLKPTDGQALTVTHVAVKR